MLLVATILALAQISIVNQLTRLALLSGLHLNHFQWRPLPFHLLPNFFSIVLALIILRPLGYFPHMFKHVQVDVQEKECVEQAA